MVRLTESQVKQARLMRRYGATLQEIADLMGVSEPAIYRWVKDTPCDKDGKRTAYRTVSDLITLLKPGVPFKQAPIPQWFLTFMEETSIIREPNGETSIILQPTGNPFEEQK